MGGLDQMVSNSTAGSTSCGRLAVTLSRPSGSGVFVGQRDAALVDIHGMDLRVGRHQAQGQGDGTPAAADVQQVALR